MGVAGLSRNDAPRQVILLKGPVELITESTTWALWSCDRMGHAKWAEGDSTSNLDTGRHLIKHISTLTNRNGKIHFTFWRRNATKQAQSSLPSTFAHSTAVNVQMWWEPSPINIASIPLSAGLTLNDFKQGRLYGSHTLLTYMQRNIAVKTWTETPFFLSP